MAVRSRRLFGPASSGAGAGGAVIYTVPAGRTAIIRTLQLHNNSAVGATIAALNLNNPGVATFFWRPEPLGALGSVFYPGTMILMPGDVLSFRADPVTATCVALGFGTLLLGSPI